MDVGKPRVWPARSLLGLLLAAIPFAAPETRGDDLAPRKLPPLTPIKTGNLRQARADAPQEGVGKPDAPAPQIEVVETEIHTAEPTLPGARLVLEVGAGAPEGTRFRWIQTEGPRVDVPDPTRGAIEVTIPPGADHLGFVLVAATADLVRVARVTVPIRGAAVGNAWGARPSGAVKADAGDDQIGLVGRRVTLNGSGSRPGEGKGARWLQVMGEPVREPKSDGAFFSFVPAQPGTYKFLLVVAADGEVSEPDEVSVVVGTPPSGPNAGQPTAAIQPAAAPAIPPPQTPARIVAAALPRLVDGARISSAVADVMEAVSQRAPLYESFAALQGELLRRLEVVVPVDPAGRTAWNDQVFSPLTMLTAQKMLAAGLDVRRREALDLPLSPAQQDVLRDHFQELARAFRLASAAR